MDSDPAFPVCELTIAEAHRAIETGEVTAAGLVRGYLARIEAYDQAGPSLNAVVSLNPEAVAEAEALDQRFSASGELTGPLHGVPLVVKDNIETEQMPTSFGNEAFADYRPARDARVVEKLRAAGAIVIAKVAMPDFATSWWGYSSRSGETRNPYDLGHDPGGSSSGTGAAVSANFAIAGLGTDCGGSVRVPSSFDNLVGVRCTPGMVSRDGLAKLLEQQDTIGPMAKSVEDAARLFDVMVGSDPRDPLTVTYRTARPPASYLDALCDSPLDGVRLGWVENLMGSPADEGRMVNEVIVKALDLARKDGATVIGMEILNIDAHVAATSLYQNCSKYIINSFLAARPEAPVRSLQQLYEKRAYHPRMDLLEACAFGPELPEHDPQYYARLHAREVFCAEVLKQMDDADVDALVYPTVRVPSPSRAELDAGRWATMEFPVNTLLAAQTWMPAMSVPVGFTSTGLPVGLEIVTRPYAEEALFRYGYGFEQATRARRAPEATPEL